MESKEKSKDPLSKKLFVSAPKSPQRFLERSSTLLKTPPIMSVGPMDLQLSLAEMQERFIIFEEVPRVLILYVSGSYGCIRLPSGGYLHEQGILEKQLRSYTVLCDNKYTQENGTKENWIFTPLSVFNKRIRYRVREVESIRPSSDVSIESMLEIGKIIEQEYNNYEAFVILHGTDTIASTSGMLSFMLENLRKTVIITACLIPLSEPRNDANNNIVAALTIAGHYWIPEVCVLFGNYLFRANRIIKDGTSALDSIKSPNFGPLAKIESYINIKWPAILYNKTKEPFSVSLKFEPNISTLAIFPFMTVETFSSAFSEDVKGIFSVLFE